MSVKKFGILKLKHKKGFTLIELIVSLVIIAIMLFIATDITVKLIRQGEKADSRAELNRSVNYALEIMKRNVTRSGSSDIFVYSSGYTGITCAASSECLKTLGAYFMAQNDSAGAKRLYQCNDSACTVKTNLVGNDVVINNLDFTYDNAGFLEISLSVYDTNQLVYSSTTPFTVVTGALVRK